MVLRWAIQGYSCPLASLNDWNICELNSSINAKVEQLCFHHIYINCQFLSCRWSVIKKTGNQYSTTPGIWRLVVPAFSNNDQVPVNSEPASNVDMALSHIQ